MSIYFGSFVKFTVDRTLFAWYDIIELYGGYKNE